MTDDCGVWVYAVADKLAAQWFSGADGVGGGSIRLVRAAGLAAAVTTVRLTEFGAEALRARLEDLAWLESIARMHHRVIEIIAGQVPVVPLRLATVYRNDDRVAAMMAERQQDIAAALDRVRGRTEWGVKAYAADVAGQDRAAEIARDDAAASPGAAYLRQRRRQLDAGDQAKRGAVASAERIHAGLGRLAAAAELRAPQDPQLSGQRDRMILNAAYLVDDERSAQFEAAVQRVADEHSPVRIELTGPWPPYSFALPDASDASDAAGERGAASAAR
jgi:hypothetical protein